MSDYSALHSAVAQIENPGIDTTGPYAALHMAVAKSEGKDPDPIVQKSFVEQMFPRTSEQFKTQPTETLADKAKIPGNTIANVGNDVLGGIVGTLGKVSDAATHGLAKLAGDGREYMLQPETEALQGVLSKKAPIASKVVGVAGRSLSDPTLAAGFLAKAPGIVSAFEKASEIPKDVAVFTGSHLANVAPEALQTSGKVLKEAAAGAEKAGSDFAASHNDFTQRLFSNPQVDEALKVSKPVDITGAIEAGKAAKVQPIGVQKIITPKGRAVNDAADNLINALRGNNPTEADLVKAGMDAKAAKAQAADLENITRLVNGGELPDALKIAPKGKTLVINNKLSATDATALRQDLDKYVTNWETPESKGLDKVVKAIRGKLKDDLIASAPPEYKAQMKDWHDKIDLSDQMMKFVGEHEGATQDVKASNFLASLWKNTPSAADKRAIVAKFDAANGTDFLGQAKKMEFARQRGIGVPDWVPPSKSGDLQSAAIKPVIAPTFANAVIPAAKGVGKAVRAIPRVLSKSPAATASRVLGDNQ